MNYTQNISGGRSYINRLYPPAALLIQQEAEREVDRLDYPGSIIYDDYPDKELLLRSIYAINERLDERLSRLLYPNLDDNQSASSECRPYLIYLIQVIFYNEIGRRRNELSQMNTQPQMY